jgi:hypothetical protein
VPVALLFCLAVYYFCSRGSSSSVPLDPSSGLPLPSEGPSEPENTPEPEDNFEVAMSPSGDDRKVV